MIQQDKTFLAEETASTSFFFLFLFFLILYLFSSFFLSFFLSFVRSFCFAVFRSFFLPFFIFFLLLCPSFISLSVSVVFFVVHKKSENGSQIPSLMNAEIMVNNSFTANNFVFLAQFSSRNSLSSFSCGRGLSCQKRRFLRAWLFIFKKSVESSCNPSTKTPGIK